MEQVFFKAEAQSELGLRFNRHRDSIVVVASRRSPHDLPLENHSPLHIHPISLFHFARTRSHSPSVRARAFARPALASFARPTFAVRPRVRALSQPIITTPKRVYDWGGISCLHSASASRSSPFIQRHHHHPSATTRSRRHHRPTRDRSPIRDLTFATRTSASIDIDRTKYKSYVFAFTRPFARSPPSPGVVVRTVRSIANATATRASIGGSRAKRRAIARAHVTDIALVIARARVTRRYREERNHHRDRVDRSRSIASASDARARNATGALATSIVVSARRSREFASHIDGERVEKTKII